MRSSSSDAKILQGDIIQHEGKVLSAQIVGINLGWDFTAEHERGIDPLLQDFGIAGHPKRRQGGDMVGPAVRTMTRLPNDLRFFKNLGGYSYLMYSSSFGYLKGEEPTKEYPKSNQYLGTTC